jgi:hypothetical protein
VVLGGASGGYFNTPQDQGADLLVQERSYQDNATPSANGVAIANLSRLALLTEKPDLPEPGSGSASGLRSGDRESPPPGLSQFAGGLGLVPPGHCGPHPSRNLRNPQSAILANNGFNCLTRPAQRCRWHSLPGHDLSNTSHIAGNNPTAAASNSYSL